jgi:hypothetical protein
MKAKGPVLNIAPDDLERIRVGQHLPPEGEHHVGLCPLCAMPSWQLTHNSKPPAVIVTVDDKPCSHCQDISFRHPEVFTWIVAVLGGQRLIAKLQVTQ